MERYIMFLREAIISKTLRTKSFLTTLVIITSFLFILFMVISLIRGGISGFNIVLYIMVYLLVLIMEFLSLFFKDKIMINKIKMCSQAYRDHPEKVLQFLKKYDKTTIFFNTYRLAFNWRFYLKQAYKILSVYKQNKYIRIKSNALLLDVDEEKTQLFYKNHQENEDTEKMKEHILLDKIPKSFREILQEFHVNTSLPFKIEEKKFKNKPSEYSLVYPVFGFVVNDSGYLIKGWEHNKPLKHENYLLHLYESYIEFEEPTFIIAIEIKNKECQ